METVSVDLQCKRNTFFIIVIIKTPSTENVSAHSYLVWYCAVLNTSCAGIAFHLETHDKNLKCGKLTHLINFNVLLFPVSTHHRFCLCCVLIPGGAFVPVCLCMFS